jgi:hypothetical protein
MMVRLNLEQALGDIRVENMEYTSKSIKHAVLYSSFHFFPVISISFQVFPVSFISIPIPFVSIPISFVSIPISFVSIRVDSNE